MSMWSRIKRLFGFKRIDFSVASLVNDIEFNDEDVKDIEKELEKEILQLMEEYTAVCKEKEEALEPEPEEEILELKLEDILPMEWDKIIEWKAIEIKHPDEEDKQERKASILLNIPRFEKGFGDGLQSGDLTNLMNYVYVRPSITKTLILLDEDKLKDEDGSWNSARVWMFAESLFKKPMFVY